MEPGTLSTSLVPVPAAGGPCVADLLDSVARLRLDRRRSRELLSFAWATGELGDGLSELCERAAPSPSSFAASEFEQDVFLSELVARVLGSRLTAGRTSFVVRLLAQPPSEPESVELRQGCFRELLAQPALRASVRSLDEALARLFELLGTRSLGSRAGGSRRKLELLREFHAVFELLVRDFAGASSGLARLASFARGVQARPAYARLGEVLTADGRAAEIELRLQVGADGTVRGLELLALRELTGNRFHRTALSRWWTRLSLLLRGFRFDPDQLLTSWLDELFVELLPAWQGLAQLRGDLDWLRWGLRFEAQATHAGLSACLPRFGVAGTATRLEGLYNPLLLADHAHVVATNIELGASAPIVVVTGPNSGGKTRLLQAVALTQLLAQSGCFVPAATAVLPRREGLVVSLLERARADQCEGRLGMELLRIRRLFEEARPGSLLILDELCSGTNPSEGEEIFRLVVELLPELEPLALVTTHFLAFAERLASEHAALEFLRVELDEAGEPTYQFVRGVAQTSLARRTAERLGVSPEALRALVRRRRQR